MLWQVLKWVGIWVGVSVMIAVGNYWRTGNADWWNAWFYAALLLTALHFYSSTVERLDRAERELRKLQVEFDQLTADFHSYVRRQRLDQ